MNANLDLDIVKESLGWLSLSETGRCSVTERGESRGLGEGMSALLIDWLILLKYQFGFTNMLL